jgi:hypothetical protein
MRRILALGCCALYLAFGFVAGAAHLHGSTDHHEETRGLHLDHVHLGDSDDRGHDHQRRLGHESTHDEDVLYLSATALRSIDSSLRLMPATVSVAATIEPPGAMSDRDEAILRQPRDPPRKNRPRPRAPPA